MANQKDQRKVRVLRMKDGSPIRFTKKQGRNEICEGPDCTSGLKVKKCSCKWAQYLRS
jgi:hypothetical protein